MDDSLLSAQLAAGFPQLTIPEQVPIVKWLGATGVQVWPNFQSPPDWPAVRREVEEGGLALRSLHAPFGTGHELLAEDEKDRQAVLSRLIGYLDHLVVLGGAFLVVHPSGNKAGSLRHGERARCRARIVEGLRTLAGEAEARGVRLALENMPPEELGANLDEVVDMVREVNHPRLGICFDTGHANLVGRFRRQWDTAAAFTTTLHVHDNDGKSDQHREPLGGGIDWERFRAALAAADYRGDVTLECLEAVVSLYRRGDADWRDRFRHWWTALSLLKAEG